MVAQYSVYVVIFVDVVIFMCTWVLLFVWLSPKIIASSIGVENARRRLTISETVYKFVFGNARIKKTLDESRRNLGKAISKVTRPLAAILVVPSFAVAYIAHTLLWGAK